jgi:hypothetical protein
MDHMPTPSERHRQNGILQGCEKVRTIPPLQGMNKAREVLQQVNSRITIGLSPFRSSKITKLSLFCQRFVSISGLGFITRINKGGRHEVRPLLLASRHVVNPNINMGRDAH